jgi:hypothetical protein
MSLSDDANNNFGRLTKGSLYSGAQLKKAERFLSEEGYAPIANTPGSGTRNFVKENDSNSSVAICLDELKCHPGLSGMMFFVTPEGTATLGLWDYVKQKELEKTRNPVLRLVKKLIL